MVHQSRPLNHDQGLSPRCANLRSSPDARIHIKGATDVVFVLDDYAEVLKTGQADPTEVLLALVGQAELKTNDTFKVL
jgi:hypothetical protein